jgi:hypothetical protein
MDGLTFTVECCFEKRTQALAANRVRIPWPDRAYILLDSSTTLKVVIPALSQMTCTQANAP